MKRKVNKLKRLLASSMILAISMTTIEGCSFPSRQSEDAAPKSVKIGVTLYDSYDLYITEFMDEFNQYAHQRSDDLGVTITIESNYALGSQSTQNNQVASMIDSDCNILCVNLVDRTDAGRVIDLAKENNVPIIFFNRELVQNDLKLSNNLYYIGAEVEDAGKKQGELALQYYRAHNEMDKNGDGALQYVVLQGEQGHQDAISRTKESVEVFKAANVKVERISSEIANWSRDQAKTKMLNILDSDDGKRVELVLANNDSMALGVIDAYKEREIKQSEWPAIFGVDGISEGLEAVKNGEMKATVWNDIPTQARGIVDFALVLSGIVDKSTVENLPDESRCMRAKYRYVIPDAESEEGYQIVDSRRDVRIGMK